MLDWREALGSHTARVGRVGEVVVHWEGNGYAVTAFGARARGRCPDIETGKRHAIEIARILLTEAATSLEEPIS